MKFTNYLASLLPSFEKDRLMEDARLTVGEFNETTIPAYESCIVSLKGYKFKSDKINNFEHMFRRNNSGFDRDFFTGFLAGLKEAKANVEFSISQIEKTYNEDVAAAGLTYAKANLMQFIEIAGFVSKYARKFLIYFLVVESAEYKENGLALSESLTKAEMKWIEENGLNFAQAFRIVTVPQQKLLKHINEIPDIVVTSDNEDTLLRTHGNKVDPLSMRLIPIWLNPIYHFRMFVAEWQANRYKAAVEELKVIQLRLLYLKRLEDGKPDAQIEKEIAYLEGRAQTLNFKIKKIEDDAEK